MSFEWLGSRQISANAGEASGRFRGLAVAAILVATAMLTSLPAAFGPVRLNDSFWIDLVWLEQFAREMGNGSLYPRWLPLSHDGLGSPVFYYYPPLGFYLASAFALTGIGTYLALIGAFFAAMLLSGAGVYLWLKDQTQRPWVGALLFMIAPYHLFNFYLRGALAEFVATAMLPFVLWGIRQIIQRRQRALAWTALAYAALIMSHLPLTMLASLFLFAPYAFLNARHSPQTLARIAAALALGVALSSIYLLPAFLLEPYRSSADLWSLSYLQPSSWSVWRSGAWSGQTFRAVMLVGAALAIPAVGLAVRVRSPWAVWTIVCIVLAVGAVPLLWSLPLLRWVQFPFRLLPVAELTLVTAVMLAPARRVPWLVLWTTFALIACFIIAAEPEAPTFGDSVMRQYHPDVPENLPPGERPYSWPSKWALQVALAHPRPQFDGKVTVEPVFYFPAWQVTCGGTPVSTFPAPRTALLAHEGSGCIRKLIWTSAEMIGAATSLAALLLLLSSLISQALLARRRSNRRETRPRNT